MTSFTLIIWTVVAVNSATVYRDWRPLVEVYGGSAHCHIEAEKLNIPKEQYRCVKTK